MSYTIHANQKDYEVTPHAANRMLERGITEEMVINTLENGEITEQEHGTDLYEYQSYDLEWDDIVIVRVVVDEEDQIIVTVIDVTDEDQ
jgi:hypothetical protein